MPTKRLVKIEAWSYSRYTTYRQCPAKAKFSCIDKLKEPDSPSGLKGTRVHALGAVWASGKLPRPDKDNAKFYPELQATLRGKKIPVELETFAEEFKSARKFKPLVEQEWAFNRNWEPTSWFGHDAWLRIKVDMHYLFQMRVNRTSQRTTVAEIVDLKTGKPNAEHELQRSLYALGAFLQYPDVQKVVASHWYLDGGTLGGPESWTRDQLDELKQDWVNATTALLNDTTFAPRPNDKCCWCHFRKANGGPCQY